MIIKSHIDPENQWRKVYSLDPNKINVNHFVVRTTLPDNPFKSHQHEQEELWFILEGEALYFEEGKETPVKKGDLIQIKSRVKHGLSTKSRVEWICLG